jgi:squalene-associated FAD-dependent desaturase
MATDEQTLIVGGGLAGLAAAAALAARDVRVTVLESRPRLGGRAGSFVDRETGETIDNCQHVAMGCCTNFRHFCETVGIDTYFRRQRELFFVGPDGTIDRFAASRWPAPFHLLSAFRSLSYLSSSDRRSLTRGIRALAKRESAAGDEESFADWLARHAQPESVIRQFWHVLLVSALSESLDRIDVSSARQVVVDGFLSNRHGWEVDIPSVPLDDLYGERIIGWLTERQVEIRLQTGVEKLIETDGRITAVELRDGGQLSADQVILAVPHQRVTSLLPESLCVEESIRGVARLESAPISSVHLWFDRSITSLPHAVFVDRLSQWLFDRTALQQTEERTTAGRHYYQVIISASRNLKEMSQAEIIGAVVTELAEVWPVAAEASLVHARVVTEHQAVFSVLPGSERFRPAQQTAISNLQLAGDWTQTGWPSTMEGAVRSGYMAAENVLTNLHRPERLVQPGFPKNLLSKILLGL